MINSWLEILIAYLITTFVLVLIPPLALRIGLVDKPSDRKLHQGSIPLIGGIAMFCGFIFGSTLLPVPLQEYRALFAAAGLLVFLGVLDDFKELSPRSRLIGQLLAALFIVGWGGVIILDLGNLLSDADVALPLWLGWIVSLFAIVSIINAINMMDGLDGLAGLLSLTMALALIILGIWHGNVSIVYLLSVFAAVIIAFLQFNWRLTQSAKVFMGDAGSMFLGLVLVCFAIKSTQGYQAVARPVTMLWLLALPLCELLTIVLYRLFERRSPLQGGRDHLHYLLLHYLKWPAWQVVLLLAFFALILAAVGVVSEVYKWPEYFMFYGFLAVFFVYAAGFFWLSKRNE